MKTLEDIQRLVKTHSNDYILGGTVRKYMNDINANEKHFIKCLHCGRYQPPISDICMYCKEKIYEA